MVFPMKMFLKRISNSFSSSAVLSTKWPTHLVCLDDLWKKLANKPVLYTDRTSILYKELDHSSSCISAVINHRYGHTQNHLSRFMQHINYTMNQTSTNKFNVGEIYGVQPRVGILCENNHHFISSLYGTWRSGCIAVPLCKLHPKEELQYVIEDSGITSLITSSEYSDVGHTLTQVIPGLEIIRAEEDCCAVSVDKGSHGNHWLSGREWCELGGMLLYTSGTTGRPKGVLTTHGNISAQLSMLVSSWRWAESDIILHCLPLHHLHGVLNALLCPLAVGASIVMMKKFDPEKVWQTLLNSTHDCSPQVSVFMGVPTMYSKLIQYHNAHLSHENPDDIKDHCRENIRLMVSGSSALLTPVSEKWTLITGHTLLERYGMTETGMCLSNPYDGTRVPGHVGFPLPTVEVKVQPPEDELNDTATGTLLVKGPAVFKGYWNRLDETQEAYTSDGWFVTGDTIEKTSRGFKILGRTSVDIIKSSGYKVSALEIERVLLEHPHISDCAVFGVNDEILGEKIVAMVVLDQEYSPENMVDRVLHDWCSQKLANYKVPRTFLAVETIPRNVMGKINKKYLKNTLM